MIADYRINYRHSWRIMIWAGVSAGIISALFQILLWLLFTDELPAILYRDARLTAAIVLGGSVLPPPMTFDVVVLLTATIIHFMISITCAALLAILTARLDTLPVPLAGIGFGVALYVVNLYGFTAIFPWFMQTRGWITLVTHGVFGLTAILVYRWLFSRLPFSNAQFRSVVH